jgi:polyisoprenyl-phosphate glycosyltransferase
MHQDTSVEISVIAPIFNETENIDEFISRTEAILKKINKSYEIILIDDFSTDGTRNKILDMSQKNKYLRSIFLSKNFGHQAAIFAGLQNAKGNFTITLDSDLQDPPELIKELYTEAKDNNYDVVNTKRITRSGENKLKLLLINFFYLINKIFFKNIEYNIGDFRIINSKIKKLINIDRKVFFYRSLIQTLGFKQKTLNYHREKRYDGDSKANLKYLFEFAFYGIFNASTIPLNFIFYLALLVTLIFLIIVFFIIVNILTISLPILFFFIFFLSFTILISLVIISQYLKYVYEIVTNKPIYIIDKYINFE